MKFNTRLLCLSFILILIQTLVSTKSVHLRDIRHLEESVESLLQGELELLREIRQVRLDLTKNSNHDSYDRHRRHLPRNRIAMCIIERSKGNWPDHCRRLFGQTTGDQPGIVSFPES